MNVSAPSDRGWMCSLMRPLTVIPLLLGDKGSHFLLQLHYHHDAVEELKQLYIDLAPPEEKEGRTWDLCVDDLKDVRGMIQIFNPKN